MNYVLLSKNFIILLFKQIIVNKKIGRFFYTFFMSITGTGNFNTHYTLESSCLLSSIVPSTHVSLCITSIHTNSKQQNIIQNNRRHLSCNKVRFKPGSARDCVLYYERTYVMYIEHAPDWMRGLVWRAPSVLVFQVHTLVCTPSTTSP